MKKIFTLIIMFLLVTTIISCGSNTDYTKEFSYLPKYENMELEKVIEPNNDSEYSTATYIISDANREAVMEGYEKVLHSDNWKTTYDNKPNLITVEKEEHEATIMAYQEENNVKLAIAIK
ncbi:hypothetical protein [Dethiothermospora halolimnae]|uniref:hypothetical protein n=1 Tax=Dethiothermospora halolimnae TaxID=3114390 RepID=UPI003CCBA7B2